MSINLTSGRTRIKEFNLDYYKVTEKVMIKDNNIKFCVTAFSLAMVCSAYLLSAKLGSDRYELRVIEDGGFLKGYEYQVFDKKTGDIYNHDSNKSYSITYVISRDGELIQKNYKSNTQDDLK
jgi:hypothetical protein